MFPWQSLHNFGQVVGNFFEILCFLGCIPWQQQAKHTSTEPEFVAEMILVEMKIENCGTKYFLWVKKSTSILFFLYEN